MRDSRRQVRHAHRLEMSQQVHSRRSPTLHQQPVHADTDLTRKFPVAHRFQRRHTANDLVQWRHSHVLKLAITSRPPGGVSRDGRAAQSLGPFSSSSPSRPPHSRDDPRRVYPARARRRRCNHNPRRFTRTVRPPARATSPTVPRASVPRSLDARRRRHHDTRFEFEPRYCLRPVSVRDRASQIDSLRPLDRKSARRRRACVRPARGFSSSSRSYPQALNPKNMYFNV